MFEDNEYIEYIVDDMECFQVYSCEECDNWNKNTKRCIYDEMAEEDKNGGS